jgi:hypothetical protein
MAKRTEMAITIIAVTITDLRARLITKQLILLDFTI